VRRDGARAAGVRPDARAGPRVLERHIILALANHGRVRESLVLFSRMTRAENITPNAITFVAVLSACNHGGLVDEGRRHFSAMTSEYGIRPRIEHYGCMVDILARAGFIEEVERCGQDPAVDEPRRLQKGTRLQLN
jgi:pentatricopeptide repeat protein